MGVCKKCHQDKPFRINGICITCDKNLKEIEGFELSRDLKWNCLAIQKDGEECKCFRKYGNFCKRHLEHYIKYSQNQNKEKPNG